MAAILLGVGALSLLLLWLGLVGLLLTGASALGPWVRRAAGLAAGAAPLWVLPVAEGWGAAYLLALSGASLAFAVALELRWARPRSRT